MTFAAVGSLITASSTTFTLVPSGVGDLILLEIPNEDNNTVFVTGVSSSNVTWEQVGSAFAGSGVAFTSVVFAGKVTSASSALVTISWSGATPSAIRLTGQEFSSTIGSWSFDVQGHLDGSGTNTWPSLTPVSDGELYYGWAWNSGSESAGSTAGYVYGDDGHGNGVAYNVNCAAGTPTAPVWGDSTSQFGVMVLVSEGTYTLYDSAVLADSPVAYWKFTEVVDSTTVVDASGNSNDGAVTDVTLGVSSPALPPGLDGTCSSWSGSGTQALVITGYKPTFTEATWEFWLNRDGLSYGGTNPRIWGNSPSPHGFDIFLNGGTDPVLDARDGTTDYVLDSGADIDDSNAWHHYAFTYDGTDLRFYLDGELTGTPVAMTGSIPPSSSGTDYMQFGGNMPWATHEQFAGLLSRAALYDTALSETQIRTHYEASSPPSAAGTITLKKSVLSGSVEPAINIVQDGGWSGATNLSSPITQTMPDITQDGNTILVIGILYDPDGIDITDVTDNASGGSNTYIFSTTNGNDNPPYINVPDGTGQQFVLFAAYCHDAAPADDITISFTNPGGPTGSTFARVALVELSGAGSVDDASVTQGISSPPYRTVLTLSDVNDIVFGITDDYVQNLVIPSGWNELDVGFASWIQPKVTGSYDVDYSSENLGASDTWGTLAIAFKPASLVSGSGTIILKKMVLSGASTEKSSASGTVSLKKMVIAISALPGIHYIGESGTGGNYGDPTWIIDYTGTQGNLLVISGHLYDTAGDDCFPVSISDDAGNTWIYPTGSGTNPPAAVVGGAGTMVNFVAWTFQDVGGVTNVTVVREDSGSNWWRVGLAEFAHVYQFDNSNAGIDNSGTNSTFEVPAVDINIAGELVIASVDNIEIGPNSPDGWTAFASASGGSPAGDLAWIINPPTGSFTPTWSAVDPGNWAAALAVFSPKSLSSGVSATGAINLKKMVISGSSTEKTVATGTVKLKKMVLSGS